MDNVTHALVGAAMAEVALPKQAAPAVRRAFVIAAVLAASAPDLDLAYTWITEPPLGYLLHHRGHTHTWPGLIVLGMLMGGAIRAWPRAWKVVTDVRGRLAGLIGAALGSHLLLDAGNVYGTHLLYPITTRWYFGDAIFIFEPWLWVVLGTGAALGARGPWMRHGLWAMTLVLPVILAALGLITAGVLAGLAAGVLAVALLLRRLAPVARALVVLALVAAAFVAMTGVSRHVKQLTSSALAESGAGAIVDIAANPNPAMPWCWSLLTLERRDPDALLVRRGTLSLAPKWYPASECASHRLLAASSDGGDGATASLRWNREWPIDAAGLRDAARDCRVAAWLQFARLPHLDEGRVVDLRFDNPLGANFTTMDVGGPPNAACPSFLTNWEWPRADVLER